MDEFFIGKINSYNAEKGCGFIRRTKGRDTFFTIDDIENFDIDKDTIELQQEVQFQIIKIKNKMKAINLLFL